MLVFHIEVNHEVGGLSHSACYRCGRHT